MLASMADALEPGDAENRKLCERLAGRVGRPVEGVASVRPAARRGWISGVGLGVDSSLAPILGESEGIVASFARVKIELTDGSKIRLGGADGEQVGALHGDVR